jgi:hypothetical protein
MAEIFRPIYYVDTATGKRVPSSFPGAVRKKSRTWHIRYSTPDGELHKVAGYRDKKATENKAAELEWPRSPRPRALAISQRTKAALSAYKARGGKLGAALPQCRNLTAEARRKRALRAGIAVSESAAEASVDLALTMKQWRSEGLTLDGIAAKLNAEGHTTRRGKPWNPVRVARVLQCAEAGRPRAAQLVNQRTRTTATEEVSSRITQARL